MWLPYHKTTTLRACLVCYQILTCQKDLAINWFMPTNWSLWPKSWQLTGNFWNITREDSIGWHQIEWVPKFFANTLACLDFVKTIYRYVLALLKYPFYYTIRRGFGKFFGMIHVLTRLLAPELDRFRFCPGFWNMLHFDRKLDNFGDVLIHSYN